MVVKVMGKKVQTQVDLMLLVCRRGLNDAAAKPMAGSQEPDLHNQFAVCCGRPNESRPPARDGLEGGEGVGV